MFRTLAFRALTAATLIAPATACHRRSSITLTVFAAASLGATMERIGTAFAYERAIEVRLELSSSRVACTKIAEQGRAADLVLSADQFLIDALLRPRHAGFNLIFAANALVLAYDPRGSAGQRLAAGEAWQRVLAQPQVRIGIANPDFAPAGYRALMALALNDLSAPAALRLGADIAARLARAHQRPSVSALLAPLETGEFDAAFLYRSVAEAHGLPYIDLGPAIDFSDPTRNAEYARVSRRVGAAMVRGAPALYGLTIPRRSPYPEAASALVAFVLSPAGRTIAAAAHLPLLPVSTMRIAGKAPVAVIQSLRQ